MDVPLYPDPPQLSVSVYPDGMPGEAAFAAMCRVVQRLGGDVTRNVRVAPKSQDFDALSDIGDLIDTLDVNEERFGELVAGGDPHLRTVAAGFSTQQTGLAVVTYDRRRAADRWPIAARTHAEGLSLAEDLRTSGERRAGRETGRWARELLRAAAGELGPLYGALAIEDTLPTPGLLAAAGDGMTDIFVSTRLLSVDRRLEFALRECYRDGHIERWGNGLFLSGWAPFNQSGRSVADPRAVGQRTAVLLTRATISWSAGG